MSDAVLQARHRLGVIRDHAVDRRDQTAKAFYVAARSGDIDKLKAVLVQNPGIDIDGTYASYVAADRFPSETALNAAIRGGHVDVVSLLLALGASPNADLGSSCHAQPVLHTPLRARPPRIDMVRLLLESGADPKGRAFYVEERTLAAGSDRCFLIDSCSHEALFERLAWPMPPDQVYLDVLDLLIAYGLDIHALPDSLVLPTRLQADLLPPDLAGQAQRRYFSVLMAKLGFEYLKVAISRGVPLPEKELSRAVTHASDPDLIRYLVFDLGFRDSLIEMLVQVSGWGPIDCRPVGPTRRQELPTVLCAAAHNNNVDCVRFLLDRGVDVNGIGRHGILPLLEAAYAKAFRDVFELLLQRGADPNVRAGGSGDNAFPLRFEIESSLDPAVVGLLLDAGVDPDARNGQGDTPLLAAAREMAISTVIRYNTYVKDRLCAFVGIVKDINAVDRHGRTALHLLADTTRRNRPSLDVVVGVLIQAGIDMTLKDENGHTARDLFQQNCVYLPAV